MTLISSRTVRGRCPVCGGDHSACGPPSASVPVDQVVEVAAVAGPLKRYKVTTPHGVETVMKLNDQDAEAYGGELLAGPSTEAAEAEAPVKARPASRNKARTASNKGGGG